MTDSRRSPPETAARTALSQAAWLGELGRIGSEDGWFRALGPRHWGLFAQDGPSLLVTFDTVAAAQARKGGLPQLCDLAATMGWSYLCIIAEGPTWFRDPAVYAAFDEMVDENFFDGFDRVLFYGAGMAGHAACTFSVAAPGARVLAVAPRASMAPARVPFEMRDRAARRLDFASRYGFAPDMLRAADRAFLLYDPFHGPDAAQAALFQGRNTSHHFLRLTGEKAEQALVDLDLLPKLVEAALKGDLGAARFGALWRERRRYGPYLKALLARAEAGGSLARVHAVCANVTRRTRAPRFRRRLDEIEASRTAPEVMAVGD